MRVHLIKIRVSKPSKRFIIHILLNKSQIEGSVGRSLFSSEELRIANLQAEDTRNVPCQASTQNSYVPLRVSRIVSPRVLPYTAIAKFSFEVFHPKRASTLSILV